MILCQPILFQCIAVNIMILLITFKEGTGHVLLWLEDITSNRRCLLHIRIL